MGYTHIVKEKDIPSTWFRLLYDIFDDEKCLAEVREIDKGSYAGCLRREFKSVLIEIENPCDPDLNKRIPTIPEGKCIPNPIDPVIYPELLCPTCGESIQSFRMLNHKFLATPCNHEVGRKFYETYRPTCDQTVIKYFGNYLFDNKLSKNEQYTYGSRIMTPVVVPLYENTEKGRCENLIAKDLMHNFKNNIIRESSLVELVAHFKNEGDQIKEPSIITPQFYYLCSYLRTNPRSNQIIMQIGKPTDVSLPDPPCCRSIDMQVKDGKLNWFIYFRSWDLWGGLPLNLCGLSMLMDQMCVDTGLEPGKFICHSKGLHLYKHSWSASLARLGRSIKDSD